MQLVDYMNSIIDNELLKYSVLFGEEQSIIDVYINKISELGYSLVYRDTVSSALDESRKSGFVEKQKLIVVSNDDEFLKLENKWSILRELKGNNLIVLRYSNIKKSSKFYKSNKDVCVEFNYVSDDVFQNYILKLVPKLKTNYVYKLQDICKNDYGKLLLETDKINSLSKQQEISVNTAFEKLLEDDLFISEIGDITFDLTNAVTYGDLKNSQKYLTQAKLKGEPVLRIVSILYQSFVNLLAYQGLGKNKINASERIGLTEKQLWAVKKNVGGYNNKELLRNINICQDVESGIKLGTIPEEVALDYLVLSCLY